VQPTKCGRRGSNVAYLPHDMKRPSVRNGSRNGEIVGAVIYTRVSTEEQAQAGTSLDSQCAACIQFCQHHGFTVLRTFVEKGESAKTADRPALKQLLEYCRESRGRVHHVVVHKLDRFARNTLDHAALKTVFSRLDITLKSVTEPIDNTPPGRFMESIFAAFAQLDNDVRAERTTSGMKHRLLSGQWTFPPPLGYVAAKAGSAKTIVPDPARAPLVRRAFEQFATGLETKSSVLRKVTALGLRTRAGRPVSAQTFTQTLLKPVYAGRIVVPEWDIDVPGNFEPIISAELFERVQSLLTGRQPSLAPRMRNHPDFPLRGFVMCGECNEPLTGSWSTGRNMRYAYYHCQSGCTRVNKAAMEEQFITYLNQLRPRREYLRLYAEVVLDVWRRKRGDAAEVRKTLNRQLADLRDKKEKLDAAFVFKNSIDKTTYDQLKDKLQEEIAVTEMALNDAAVDELEIETLVEFAQDVVWNASNLWKQAALAEKQRFQQLLFPEGVLYHSGSYRTTATCIFFNGLELPDRAKDDLVALPGIEPGF
jgi:site-specific DNA recombinase